MRAHLPTETPEEIPNQRPDEIIPPVDPDPASIDEPPAPPEVPIGEPDTNPDQPQRAGDFSHTLLDRTLGCSGYT